MQFIYFVSQKKTAMPIQVLVLIALAFIFMFVELMLRLRKTSARKPGIKSRSDRGSLFILWFVITVAFTIGFNFADYNEWTLLNYLVASLGLLLYFSGMFIRWIAVKQLSIAFTVDVSFSEGQELVTVGMYKKVRRRGRPSSGA